MTAQNQNSYHVIPQIKDHITRQACKNMQDQIAQVRLMSQGPIVGTLSPDTKPTLNLQNAGTLFFATDFNRLYQWTGSAWIDAPGQPTRGQITLFDPNTTPGAGWLPCNGTQGTISTPSGSVSYFQSTNLPATNGQLSWVRV